MTHTPGPWRVSRDSYGIVRIWADYRGEECDVACPEGDGSINSAERDANARLIAAAPELLTALQGLLADYQNALSDSRQRDVVVTAAKAAIAKATAKD